MQLCFGIFFVYYPNKLITHNLITVAVRKDTCLALGAFDKTKIIGNEMILSALVENLNEVTNAFDKIGYLVDRVTALQ